MRGSLSTRLPQQCASRSGGRQPSRISGTKKAGKGDPAQARPTGLSGPYLSEFAPCRAAVRMARRQDGTCGRDDAPAWSRQRPQQFRHRVRRCRTSASSIGLNPQTCSCPGQIRGQLLRRHIASVPAGSSGKRIRFCQKPSGREPSGVEKTRPVFGRRAAMRWPI